MQAGRLPAGLYSLGQSHSLQDKSPVRRGRRGAWSMGGWCAGSLVAQRAVFETGGLAAPDMTLRLVLLKNLLDGFGEGGVDLP